MIKRLINNPDSLKNGTYIIEYKLSIINEATDTMLPDEHIFGYLSFRVRTITPNTINANDYCLHLFSTKDDIFSYKKVETSGDPLPIIHNYIKENKKQLFQEILQLRKKEALDQIEFSQKWIDKHTETINSLQTKIEKYQNSMQERQSFLNNLSQYLAE